MTQSSSLENINTVIGLLNTKCNILSNNINNIPTIVTEHINSKHSDIPEKSKEYFRAGLEDDVFVYPNTTRVFNFNEFTFNVEYSSASIIENGVFTAQRDGLYYISFVPTYLATATATYTQVSLLKSTDGGEFAEIQQAKTDFSHVSTTPTSPKHTTPIFGVHALLAGDKIAGGIHIEAPASSSNVGIVLGDPWVMTNFFGFNID